MVIDWQQLVRQHLADVDSPPEAESVAELAQLLEDASEGRCFASPEEVEDWLKRQIPDWGQLASRLKDLEEPQAPLQLFAPPSPEPSTPDARPFLSRLRLGWGLAADHLRYAWRRLAQKPGFTAAALVSLAIGIGANSAIFSLVNVIVLRQVPLKDPARLVDIYLELPELAWGEVSYPTYDDIVESTAEIFDGVVASNIVIGQTQRDGASETILGEAVSGNYFHVLGVDTYLGRPLLPADDIAPGAHPVVVLGYSYWQSRFGADPHIVGKNLRLAGRPFEIVGVAPRSYPGNTRPLQSAFYAPRMMVNVIQGFSFGGRDALQNRRNHANSVKARLRPGVSLAAAQTVVEGVADRLGKLKPAGWDERASFRLRPTSEVLVDPEADTLVKTGAWLLSAMVGLVLMMACANLAGFLLAQAVDRRKEIALRLALGASRSNLISQLLTESLLLAALGGTAGIALAEALLRAVGRDLSISTVSIELDVGLDFVVLGYTAGITLLAGLALGLLPALQSTRPDLASALKQAGARGGEPDKQKLRTALIGFQVATSTVLLVGAGLFLRSFQQTQAVDPGFGRDSAVVMSVLMPATRFDEQKGRLYLENLVDRVGRVAGVRDVGAISRLHLGAAFSTEVFNVDGVDPPQNQENGHTCDTALADPDLLAALGVQIIEGRNFTEHDRADSSPVAIVSEAFVERFFTSTGAIGQFLRREGRDDLLIVGVASNAAVHKLGEAPRPFVYKPSTQDYSAAATVVARTDRAAAPLVKDVLRAANEYDPELWSWQTTTMENHIGAKVRPAQQSALVLSALALIAVSLAAIGLYGIVSYSVSQRTREIGIRVALGADTRSVVLLLMATGLRAVLVGGVAGLLVSVFLSRLVESFLFGVEATDPPTFLGAAAVLAASAIAATWLPAQRVSRVSPIRALRTE